MKKIKEMEHDIFSAEDAEIRSNNKRQIRREFLVEQTAKNKKAQRDEFIIVMFAIGFIVMFYVAGLLTQVCGK